MVKWIGIWVGIWCLSGVAWAAPKPILVTGMIAPISALVRQIGGDTVVVTTLVPPGASPHVFEPLPSAVRQLKRSAAVITIGNLGMGIAAPSALRSLVPNARILDLSDGVALLDSSDDHDRDGDPHIWMSPEIMQVQTRRIEAVMSEINPSQKALYHRNADRIVATFAAIQARYAPQFKGKKIAVMVVHPSMAYLANDMGFKELSIESHGKAPSAKELRSMIASAKALQVRTILLQPQYSKDLVGPLARQLNAKVITVDVYGPDYPNNISRILDQIIQLRSL